MSSLEITPKFPSSVLLGQPVPLEDAGTGREIAEKVRQGKALLEIVSTPWGIEFFVRDVVRKP